MDKLPVKDIVKESFWQLLAVYSFLILIVALGFFSKYSIYFNALALIVAILGVFYFSSSTKESSSHPIFRKNIFYLLFSLSILFILSFRLIPYLYNGYKIPLGYDAGIYKYAIEHGLTNLDLWVRAGVEPGFLYFMTFLNSALNIPSQFLLTYGFIFCILCLGLSIYYFTKTYFNDKEIA